MTMSINTTVLPALSAREFSTAIRLVVQQQVTVVIANIKYDAVTSHLTQKDSKTLAAIDAMVIFSSAQSYPTQYSESFVRLQDPGLMTRAMLRALNLLSSQISVTAISISNVHDPAGMLSSPADRNRNIIIICVAVGGTLIVVGSAAGYAYFVITRQRRRRRPEEDATDHSARDVGSSMGNVPAIQYATVTHIDAVEPQYIYMSQLRDQASEEAATTYSVPLQHVSQDANRVPREQPSRDRDRDRDRCPSAYMYGVTSAPAQHRDCDDVPASWSAATGRPLRYALYDGPKPWLYANHSHGLPTLEPSTSL